MSAPRHAAMSGWALAGDHLAVNGIPLPRLAERVGRTPFYAYDRALIDRRVAALRACFPERIKLHYAIKANPMPALVCHMAARVDGLDVASAGELRVALDSGIAPGEISFAGPGKQPGELAQAVAAGVLINVESTREVERLAALAHAARAAPRIAVRVNPGFELKSSGMKMGGGPKPFGVDAEAVPQLIDAIADAGLALEGFHIFSGSQNLRADAIVEAQSKSVDLALQLAASAKAPIRVLNIGGGFGIPYFPGDVPLDLDPIAENLHALHARVMATLPEASLVVELGRYLVGEAGIYVCRVIDRKVSRGQVFLVTDGGMHHHLAASGNFGQILRKNYPVTIGNRMNAQEFERASVVGPLCTPLDVIADGMDLARAEEGDYVVVFQSGAYGLTASPTGFLGHPPPLEVLV